MNVYETKTILGQVEIDTRHTARNFFLFYSEINSSEDVHRQVAICMPGKGAEGLRHLYFSCFFCAATACNVGGDLQLTHRPLSRAGQRKA